VSLAHNGVLFLDELSEFRRGTLEALRQPLEDGFVTISRAQITATFPARPMVVGATNPCPCGFRGDSARRCVCQPQHVRAYRSRLSGPLVDRLDIHVVLPPVDVLSLRGKSGGERSAAVRVRVEEARAIQRDRFTSGETDAGANAHLSAKDAERVCALDDAGAALIGGDGLRFRLAALELSDGGSRNGCHRGGSEEVSAGGHEPVYADLLNSTNPPATLASPFGNSVYEALELSICGCVCVLSGS